MEDLAISVCPGFWTCSIEYGFIDVAETSAGLHPAPTLYAISERWRAYGTPEFVPRLRPVKHRFNGHIGLQKGHPF